MTPLQAILIRLLARVDVIHRPHRRADWLGDGSAVVSELRESYRTGGGVAWRIGGSATARSREERSLADAAGAGLLEIRGPQGKHRKLRLTERGEAVGRSLAGLPSLADAWRLTREVAALSINHTEFGLLASELWLAGLKTYTDDCHGPLMEVCTTISPAVIRGFVSWRSDLHGKAYLTISGTGIEWAGGPEQTTPGDLPKELPDGFDVYGQEANRYRNELRDTPAPAGDIGEIPLPCSISLKRPKNA